MKLKNCASVLFAKNAKVTKDFYVNLLGMTVIAEFGGMNFIMKEGFAIWQPDTENIIPRTLGAENICNAETISRFELCFETEDIVEAYKTAKNYGVKFLHEMNEEIWGQRSIRFYDPDGHLIEVGEAMEIFIRRIYEEENGNVEAVSRRTFMQPEGVKHFLGL